MSHEVNGAMESLEWTQSTQAQDAAMLANYPNPDVAAGEVLRPLTSHPSRGNSYEAIQDWSLARKAR